MRAIHDWETTFVECLRLRCCGTTFLAAPEGLTPRARYSDRVVGLSRALVGLGLPLRRCARLLDTARVPATVQAIRRWCADVTPETSTRARARVLPRDPATAGAPPPLPHTTAAVALPLGARAWLLIDGVDPERVESTLRREMTRRHPAPEPGREARCHVIVIPRGPGLPYRDAMTP